METINELVGMTLEECITEYTPYIKKIAAKYFGSVRWKCQMEDLVQEGVLSIILAYRGFKETESKVTFSTYAYRAIENNIYVFVNTKINFIRIPLRRKKEGFDIENVGQDEAKMEQAMSVITFDEYILDEYGSPAMIYIKTLTKKEKFLLKYLSLGHRAQDVALELGESKQTVSVRRTAMQRKFLYYIENEGVSASKVKLTIKSLSVLRPNYREKFIREGEKNK